MHKVGNKQCNKDIDTPGAKGTTHAKEASTQVSMLDGLKKSPVVRRKCF